jgi:hypothetical protein
MSWLLTYNQCGGVIAGTLAVLQLSLQLSCALRLLLLVAALPTKKCQLLWAVTPFLSPEKKTTHSSSSLQSSRCCLT